MSEAEEALAGVIRLAGLPQPEREYRFAPGRRFRADFCWGPPYMLLVECEGGRFIPGGGRHQRAEGFRRDMDKYNLATLLGYRLIRVTPEMVASGEALALIEAALEGDGE